MPSSLQSGVLGVQTPTRLTGQTSEFGWGPEVIELAAHYGIGLDTWQELCINEFLMTQTQYADLWLTQTDGLAVPRQQGKSYITKALEVAALLLPMGFNNILHTAQLSKTSDSAFRAVYDIFMSHPDLRKLIVKKSEVPARCYLVVKGFDGVERRADFVSRGPESGRGLSIDLLIYDEGQSVAEREFKSLQYTVSARPNHKTILLGTVPEVGDPDGEIFRRLRNRSLTDDPGSLKWIEWGADDGDDLDDELTIAKANPAYGTRLTKETVREEREQQTEQSFAMERCGQWQSIASREVIPLETWNTQEVDINHRLAEVVSDRAIAVDVSPSRGVTSVSSAGKNSDGDYIVALMEQFSNPDAAVKYVAKMVQKNDIRAVVVDGKSQAATLIDAFKREGIKVTITTEKDMATSCGSFFDGVMDGWLHHIGQPQLTMALQQARKRPLLGGEAWGWNRKNSSSDITPLVAASLALFGSMNSKVKHPGGKKPGYRQRLIILP